MSTYAAKTDVSVERSRGEIERTLARYGATSFGYGWNEGMALIEFVAAERRICFLLELPDRADRKFTHHSRGRRTGTASEAAWEQACRQRWRALLLVIKAKLEAIQAGISTFEEEFAMRTVLPDGSVAADHVLPAISQAYATGEVRPLLALGR